MMARSDAFRVILGFVVPCLVVGCITVLCIVLVPVDKSADRRRFTYEVQDDGKIVWSDSISKDTKLVISSNSRSVACERCITCDDDITFIKSSQGVECYEVRSMKTKPNDCKDTGHDIQDCIGFDKDVFWYGGSELYLQKWPINDVQMDRFGLYLSTDLPWRYGNVLERYWVSSSGVAIYVYPEVPLYVSHTAGEKMCLRADYNSSVIFGRNYNHSSHPDFIPGYVKTELLYAACFGYDVTTTHSSVLKSNNDTHGFIDRPSALPDTKMLKDPIWSTWARYKRRINQTIIENFANEILTRNFSNSQLEIDDGYEENYGDFTFDPEKFPDTVGLIANLHKQGFRVTTWVTHFINTQSRNFLSGRNNGYFIREANDTKSPALVTWWNGVGAVVDFTNSQAASWYEDILQDVKDTYGIDSFKFDAGETNYIPRNGWTASPMSNPGDFTTLYAQSAYRQGGNIMEMRSAWRTQSYPFYMRMMDKASRWGGFKGLRTLIPTALTFGLIGYPYVLPDMVGGNAYGGLKPGRELYIRWLEVNAFMPVLQFSITPWDYDEEVTEIAQYYTTLHRTIVYEEIVRVAQRYIDGESIFLPVSPIWYLSAPDETAAFTADDEFLVGERYLVAPVVREGETKRDIYLPRGRGKTPILWRDRLRYKNDIYTEGGRWIKNYDILLHEISWWEKV